MQEYFPEAIVSPALEESVWGDHADPDRDRCVNLMEFVMNRDPNAKDINLGVRVRLEGDDLVASYRQTTLTNHSVTWLGWWPLKMDFWVTAGVRYSIIETHPGYHLVEARIARNREKTILFRLVAER